jgi:hypothetical protein
LLQHNEEGDNSVAAVTFFLLLERNEEGDGNKVAITFFIFSCCSVAKKAMAK